ncbi:MAG: hypothetical protein ACJAVL_002006, partial [Bacteroidia bacterium]
MFSYQKEVSWRFVCNQCGFLTPAKTSTFRKLPRGGIG